MKGLVRRLPAFALFMFPALVLAALAAETSFAAGLDMMAPAAAAAPPAVVAPGALGWFQLYLSAPLIRIGGALLFFLIGWVVAKSVSYAVFTLLSKTDLDNRVAKRLGLDRLFNAGPEGQALERFIAQVVYWLLMVMVLVGVLQMAGFSQVAAPLQGLVDTVAQALPRVFKATIILALAYVIARILHMVISTALDSLGVDSRFARLTESKADDLPQSPTRFSQVAANVAFWLMIVFGLAGALEALEIEPLAAPLRNAIDQVIGLLPRLASAALLLFFGYVLGRILRVLARNVLQGLGFDRLVARIGLQKVAGRTSPSDLVGLTLMVFVLMQATIAALNQLGLATLAVPLTDMMSRFWTVLPALAASVVIVAVGVFVGGLLRRLVSTALRNLGFDRLMERLGFTRVVEREDRLGEFSEMVGFAVQLAVVLVALAQALDNLGLDTWAVYVNAFLTYLVKNVAVALLIVLVGFVSGGYVRDLVRSRQTDAEASNWIPEFARYAVLVFAFTMAVQQLDVAEDFVLLTFGLLFGALCLAMALAFGLGSRDVAGDIVRKRYEAAQSSSGSGGGGRGGLRTPLGGPKPPLAGSSSPGSGPKPPVI